MALSSLPHALFKLSCHCSHMLVDIYGCLQFLVCMYKLAHKQSEIKLGGLGINNGLVTLWDVKYYCFLGLVHKHLEASISKTQNFLLVVVYMWLLGSKEGERGLYAWLYNTREVIHSD